MAQVLVRNLPDEVVARLKARAANENKSLEKLLREVIEREARPDKAEALERLRLLRESLPPIDADLSELIRQGREERDKELLRALRGE